MEDKGGTGLPLPLLPSPPCTIQDNILDTGLSDLPPFCSLQDPDPHVPYLLCSNSFLVMGMCARIAARPFIRSWYLYIHLQFLAAMGTAPHMGDA